VLVEVVLPLLLAALVGLVVVVFLRRANRALARTRELERYGTETADLAERVDAVLRPLTERVDAVRRNQVPAGEIEAELTASIDLLSELLSVAEAVRPPVGVPASAEVAAQIDRAIRAVDTVRYGCGLASGAGGRRGKELEAQTSIKRGYLNLLHAREAVSDEATRARAAADVGPRRRWRTSRA
jgi:hypothetical protein